MVEVQGRLAKARKTVECMCRQGYKPTGIAKRFGCTESEVREALAGWGVAAHEGKQPVDEAKVLELHASGMSAYAINKELGLGKNKAERVLRAAGIDISGRQKKRVDPLVNHADEIVARYLAGEGVDAIGKDFGC